MASLIVVRHRRVSLSFLVATPVLGGLRSASRKLTTAQVLSLQTQSTGQLKPSVIIYRFFRHSAILNTPSLKYRPTPPEDIAKLVSAGLDSVLEFQSKYTQIMSIGGIVTYMIAVFRQPQLNRMEADRVAQDIEHTLRRIQELTQEPSAITAPQLQNDLAVFVAQLQDFLNQCNTMLERKPLRNRWKGVYDPNNIRDELARLQRKVQKLREDLVTQSQFRTEQRVAHIDTKVDQVLFTLNSQDQKTVQEIQDEALEKVTNDTDLAQEMIRVDKMSASEASQLLDYTRMLEARESTSEVEKKYLRTKIGVIKKALPDLPHGTSITTDTDAPLKSEWATHYAETGKRDSVGEDMVQELLRITKLLQSDKGVPIREAANAVDRLILLLGDLNMWKEATEMGTWAVKIRRDLKGDDVDSSGHLAVALNNLSKWYSKTGNFTDAVVALEEAVSLARQFVKADPTKASLLASFLNNLSSDLNKLNRFEEALEASEESVKIRRQYFKNLGHINPDMSLALSNSSPDLSNLGRHEDAVMRSQEAAENFRKLANDDPARYRPFLARSLINLSASLNDSRKYQEALQMSEESVMIVRELAKNDPRRFNLDLARSLGALHSVLNELGRHGDSYKALSESVDLYRKLVKDQEARFSPDLASHLHNMAVVLTNLERHNDALRNGDDSVNMYRKLFDERGSQFLLPLVDGLLDNARLLYKLGRLEEMIPKVDEAMQRLSDRQKPDGPHMDYGQLARCLYFLSDHLSILGFYEEAVEVSKECVVIGRSLSVKRPDIYASVMRIYRGRHARALEGKSDLAGAVTDTNLSADYRKILSQDLRLKFISEPKEALVYVSDGLTTRADIGLNG